MKPAVRRTVIAATATSTLAATAVTVLTVLPGDDKVPVQPAGAAAQPAGLVGAAAGPAGIRAQSALLAQMGNGKVRWGKAADTKRPIGSITKVMTAMVVLRAGNLNQKITIKQSHINYAVNNGASRAYLRAGDKLTARELLYAMMLPSGTDAAVALAEKYGPGRAKFIKKMNNTAKQLKLTRTRYTNFDGLPYPTPTAGYSTARDQVKLGRLAMKRPVFRQIVARKNFSLPATGSHRSYKWINTNRLIGWYGGANGIKTGTTDAAGYCLMFTARRGNRNLIGIVLRETVENARFTDAAKMLNWGFGVRTASTLVAPPVPPGANVD